MKHPSLYLDWYLHVPKVKYDFRSSGIAYFKHNLSLDEIDLSVAYVKGNPEATKLLAQMYGVKPENVFISSEGASGQNARIIRCLREKSEKKDEAIVEYPAYEPLLRLVQENFPLVTRLERIYNDGYSLNAEALRKAVSDRTGLLVITNPHAPSGAIADRNELREIMDVASEYGFYVICDEIYAEFNRHAVPTLFSVNEEFGIVTTSFTKAYGLGGLKLGVAIASASVVETLYNDVLNTVGNSPNVVQLIAVELFTKGRESLDKYKQKWTTVKNETEKWLEEKDLECFPNKDGVTYWVKTPITDTFKWINEHAIPRYGVAPVPGTFFLFKNDYEYTESNMMRLGLGNINPDKSNLTQALDALEKAMNTY